jgi:hypothetical protein
MSDQGTKIINFAHVAQMERFTPNIIRVQFSSGDVKCYQFAEVENADELMDAFDNHLDRNKGYRLRKGAFA